MSSDYDQDIQHLSDTLSSITAVIDPDKLKETISELSKQAAAPDLWDDADNAQAVTSKLSHAQTQLEKLRDMRQDLEDVVTLLEMADEEEGADAQELTEEATGQLQRLKKEINDLEIRTLLSGEYDERYAVVSIRAGSGGVDAADFAEMLLRMYTRWAEQHHYSVDIMDTSYGEEAGIKSATFQVNAPYAYGFLSIESGTHRLVRISPFDNAARRHTSFAAVEVIPLIETTDQIDIPDSELKIEVFRSSGPGGQSVNTTDSAVRMTHIPTGIVVSMQNEKSQIQNRAAALRVLQSRLLILRREEEEAKKKELKGDVKATWGDQMRSYVTHPYQKVKDLRTGYESGNTDAVFDGDIDEFLAAGIRWRREQNIAPQ